MPDTVEVSSEWTLSCSYSHQLKAGWLACKDSHPIQLLSAIVSLTALLFKSPLTQSF